MAYRTDISTRDRSRAIALVILIHAALLFIFLHLSGKIDLADPQPAMSLFNFSKPPSQPPLARSKEAKSKLKEGKAGPRNIRSEATAVIAPKPKIVTPPIQHIAATDMPRSGAAPAQGASEMRGPGIGGGGARHWHRQRRQR